MQGSIHIIGSRQMGGADRFFVRLVQALNEAGHSAVPVTRAATPIARRLRATATGQIHLPLANSWDLYSAWRIRDLVKSRRPQVVQTYMGRATRLTHLPASGGTVHIARLGGYYKLEGYYRHAHAWIGNTRGICDYLIRSGLPAERVFHISNFAPNPSPLASDALTVLRERLGLPSGAWIVFALGRLLEKKGFDDLLHAFAQLPAMLHDRPLHLLIAGDGAQSAQLQTLSAGLGVRTRVHWLGWQEQPGPYFALADLVVCPSRHEPLGNVILEAWSYGKAVLSTAAEGPIELITDDANGLLAPARDPGALARRLREALGAEGTLARLGRAGYETLQARFSKEAIVRQYLELYALLAK